jgi:hypothetical protein
MKITIKFTGSDDWEELKLLSEDSDIQAIKVDDVIITEDAVRCREIAKDIHQTVSRDRQRPLQTVQGSAHARNNFFNSHFYGILDVINHKILTIQGPLHVYLGREEHQLLERGLFEFIHPEDLVSTQRMLATLLGGQSVIDFPINLITSHGKYLPLFLTSSPAENGIAAFYASLVDSKDLQQTTLVYGYKRKDLIGHSHLNFIPEQYHKYLTAYLDNAFHSKNTNGMERTSRYKRIVAGGEQVLVEGMLTQCDVTRRTFQFIEREVDNKMKVVSLTCDFDGNIINCCPLSEFLQ